MADENGTSAADKANQLLKLLQSLGLAVQNGEESARENGKEHKFWHTQPVPKSMEELINVEEDGPIKRLHVDEIPDAPLKLLDEFEWFDLDINGEKDKNDLYVLLNENYVEDLDSKFRFDYPPNFLEWALKAPGWKKHWHVGVRIKENGKLVAFISAIPTRFRVESVEVNFLCIHKKLRSKRLAPVLIKEITRRVNKTGIFQALYTAGLVLPEPISTARYHHRPLNYGKLLEAGFTCLPSGVTLAQQKEKYRISKSSINLRELTTEDIPAAFEIFSDFMKLFDLVPLFNLEEFSHWIQCRDNLVYSYVSEVDGKIVDFVTFYSLPTSVLETTALSHIKVAYLFYYGVSDPSRLTPLMQAALLKAKEVGFDVFNCVDIMKNQAFMKELLFALGDGSLHYYLYNWKTTLLKPDQIGVVML